MLNAKLWSLILMQLRTGRADLAAYLYRINRRESGELLNGKRNC
jgi:hypothetical protein